MQLKAIVQYAPGDGYTLRKSADILFRLELFTTTITTGREGSPVWGTALSRRLNAVVPHGNYPMWLVHVC